MKLLHSFRYAFKGLLIAAKEELNFRIHLFDIVIVIVAGASLRVSVIEWAVLALTIGLVIAAELFNTAIEDIVNFISPEFNEKAGRIKDVSAAAVMVTAFAAIIVAAYILGTKIMCLF